MNTTEVKRPAGVARFAPPKAGRWLARPPEPVALLIYLVAALLLFGAPLFQSSAHTCICLGSDEGIFVWAMAWWPHALVHGLNPFDSHIIYAPQGFNIALGALIPGAALLLAPVTAIAGPLFSYNLAMLLSPVLAAFFAFLLCRRVTGAFWASLVGGWLFGFSTYLLAELLGHTQLTLVFLIPAIVHLVLRAFAGEISRRWFAVAMVIALALQFLFSAEVFVTMTLFGAVALVSGLVLLAPDQRARLRRLLPTIGVSYLLTAVLVSPYLYYALKPGGLPILLWRTDHFSNDLLSFLIPTQVTALGGLHFLSTSNSFSAGFVEGGAYFGLPLIAILLLAAWRWRRRPEVRVMLVTMFVVIVCSLGGRLQVKGHYTIPLPWAIFHRLPVLGQALPSRFIVYAFLIGTVLATMWLASARWPVPAWGLAALSIVFLWPAVGRGYWHGTPDLPNFFTTTAYRSAIGRHDTALVLPVGSNGNSMLWQAEAHLGFNMASGYVVAPEAPDPYKRDPIYPTLTAGTAVPNERAATASFLASHHVTVAVLNPADPVAAPWIPLLEGLGWTARADDGALLLRPRAA